MRYTVSMIAREIYLNNEEHNVLQAYARAFGLSEHDALQQTFKTGLNQQISLLPAALEEIKESSHPFVSKKTYTSPQLKITALSFLQVAQALDLDGPEDWAEKLDDYLYAY